MDELTIFWTQTAKRQSEHIFVYWNNRNKSKSYSKKLNFAIKERIELLKSHPEMGEKNNSGDTKEISMRHYSNLYKIDKPKILITGFWDNRQDPKKLLNFLKE